MRLASSRRRLAQPSSSRSPALAPWLPPSAGLRAAIAWRKRAALPRLQACCAQRHPPRRPSSTTAAASPAPRLSDDDRAALSASPASSSSSHTYLSHLKRRGHFRPAPLERDAAAPPAAAAGPLLLSAEHYGKWRDLVFDYDRLLFEAGLVPAGGAAAGGGPRSVDRPEHAADLGLWSAIFNFAQRRGGSDGARVVWQEIFQRKQLHRVDGVVARAFWQAVAEAALDDEAFLASTWAYAEWMWAEHGARWPDYYRTVVAHCLAAQQYDRALRWHVRLSAHFAVPKRAFFGLLAGFLPDPDPALQDALQALYATSHHHQLYDTIVPLLWSRGQSAQARAWRETLVRHGDGPASGWAARPFLQHLAGYYPEVALSPQEQAVASARLPPPSSSAAAGPFAPRSSTPAERAERAERAAPPALPTNLFHLLNRVHGETFGIAEKTTFNDKIGAKWFATSWVSLDTAIHLVYSLGVAEIGPLSLQSIALREGAAPAGVVRRLQQLAQCQIGIGARNYARAVRQLARAGDAATLGELLRSTLHPDVFDDVVLQRYVLGSAAFTGDWQTHRLLLAVRLAVSEDAMVAASNRLLLACLQPPEVGGGGTGRTGGGTTAPPQPGRTTAPRRKATALKLLDEFAARGIELLPATADALSRRVQADLLPPPSSSGGGGGGGGGAFHPQAAPDVDFYAALCRRLVQLRAPVATEAWHSILCVLGRQGRLAALETVALDVVDQYVALQTAVLPRASSSSSAPPPSFAAFKVHVDDVPDVVRGGGGGGGDADLGYRLLPRDLALDHPLHPLSLVFRDNLVASVVRWYFHRRIAYRQGSTHRLGNRLGNHPGTAALPPPPPRAYGLAGGIRLLAMLRQRGVAVARARVRAETLVCVAAVFGPPSMATRYWQPARAANQLTLGEVKALCDAAWATGGGDAEEEASLLPDVAVLERALAALQPVAASFGSQLTRRGDKSKVARQAFMDAVAGGR